MLASQRSTSLSLANREGKTHAHAKISHTKLNFTVVNENSEHGGERLCNHAKSAAKKIKQCAQRFDTKCTKMCSSAEERSPTGHRGAPHLAGPIWVRCSNLFFFARRGFEGIQIIPKSDFSSSRDDRYFRRTQSSTSQNAAALTQ